MAEIQKKCYAYSQRYNKNMKKKPYGKGKANRRGKGANYPKKIKHPNR